jgi:hypothetical protein
MATFLDAGGVDVLRYFMPGFTFIFVLIILYAILDKTGLLGKNKAFNAIVSFIIALTVLFSGSALELINFITPWFAVIIVVSVMAVLLLSFYVKEGGDLDLGPIPVLAMIFAGIVLIIGITNVFGPVFTPYAEGAGAGWVALRTLFHPRVLGAFLILLIAAFTIKHIVEF